MDILTESWLQAACKAGGKSHQRNRQGLGRREPCGWEKEDTHIRTFLTEDLTRLVSQGASISHA